MKRALLVATDLDACLLDEHSYSWDAARPALARLRDAGGLLVLASSKTRAEMEPLAEALGCRPPLIVENGGAIVVPPGRLRSPAPAAVADGRVVIALGAPRRELVRALAQIGAEGGGRLIGFSELDAAAVARLTGLAPDAAARALLREFDEPFLVEPETAAVDAVAAAAERRGLRVTRGGRFFHLSGRSDKGAALRRLLALLADDGQRFETLALGDSPNDIELLGAADRAVIVPHQDGPDPSLVAALPHASLAPAPGPAGWNQAVLLALA